MESDLSSPATPTAPVDVLLTWHESTGFPVDWPETVERWPEPVPDPSVLATVHHARAEYEGVTIGVHLATPRRDGQLQTVWCGVAPEWRGRGVAQRLIARHLRWAAEQGRYDVRAHTPAGCPAMVVANLKVGFEIVGSFSDPAGAVVVILQARRG
ncbi:MAG: GNAT family N-acetyltransferase [Myxococcota bacterium]